jgi:hypothetical protein
MYISIHVHKQACLFLVSPAGSEKLNSVLHIYDETTSPAPRKDVLVECHSMPSAVISIKQLQDTVSYSPVMAIFLHGLPPPRQLQMGTDTQLKCTPMMKRGQHFLVTPENPLGVEGYGVCQHTDPVCSNSVDTFGGDKVSRYLCVQSHLLAEWVILCFDSFLFQGSMKSFEKDRRRYWSIC